MTGVGIAKRSRGAWADPAAEGILRDGIAEGVSYSEISSRLHRAGFAISRNAAIGKALRLGLQRSQTSREAAMSADGRMAGHAMSDRAAARSKGRSKGRTKAGAPAVKQAADPALQVVPKVAPPVPGGVLLMEAAAGACRWPVAGDGAGLRVCGATAARGSYCPACHRLAYEPATLRPISAPVHGTRRAPPHERARDTVDQMAHGLGEAA